MVLSVRLGDVTGTVPYGRARFKIVLIDRPRSRTLGSSPDIAHPHSIRIIMRRHALLAGGVALVTALAGVAVAVSASAGTTTYEAEAAVNTLAGGAHAIGCDRCSGNARVTGIGLLGRLTFTHVTAERSGPTKLTVTYVSPDARTASISVNGGAAIVADFPATRSDDRPGITKVVASLRTGDNTITFGNPRAVAPDIDKMVITTDGTPPPAPAAVPGSGPATYVPAAPVPSYSTPAYSTPPYSTPPGTPPTSPPAAGEPTFEQDVVALVNVQRAKAGCKPVTSDDRLVTAARAHSADMAARHYFSHATPEKVDFAARITRAGYRWSGAGENIAKGPSSPAAVMSSWMASTGHRANILNCSFTNVGVGVVADPAGTLLWTQDFARPLT
jgi:uncharacterized protein YkwD